MRTSRLFVGCAWAPGLGRTHSATPASLPSCWKARGRAGRALLLLALAACGPARAAVDCGALDATAEREGTIVPDVGSGRDIVGRGRLQFHSAPDSACAIDGLFVVPGDTLFAQLEYGGFTRVAFIAMKKTDRQDVVAWVPSSRLRANGQGIVPGSRSQGRRS